MWRIEYKNLLLLIITSFSLEALNIRPVAELSLPISPKTTSIKHNISPLRPLLFAAEHFYGVQKGRGVELDANYVKKVRGVPIYVVRLLLAL